jgi:hypothetical protein
MHFPCRSVCRVTVPAVKLQASVTLLHLFFAHHHFAIEAATASR